MITAVAFESLVKLLSFLAIGIYVTFGIFGGFSNLFDLAAANPNTAKLMTFPEETNGGEWFWLSLLSFFAVILLPRQFHVAVVENSNPNYVSRAMWLFPLYMLLINIFVLPIAYAGLMQLEGTGFRPDNFVLGLPLVNGQGWLALVAFIGGLSAATGMVIVEVTALSIMTSNHLIMPSLVSLVTKKDADVNDFSKILIAVRRVGILLIMLLAFAYVRTIATDRPLVSIGLVSFAAVTQFAPALFGGLFWKRATKLGAIWGLLVGFLIWLITLPIPTLAEVGLLDKSLITNGYFGQSWLRPYELFGLKDFDHISHATFWSLLLNTMVFVCVSLNTQQSASEASQADYFVNIYKYLNVGSEFEVLKREAKVEDLKFLLNRFLGEERTHYLLKVYEDENYVNLSKITKANAELVNYVETLLTGAIGASSAKILMASVVKEDPISIDEMLTLLDQTQEIVLTNRALERKSQELEATTKQLQTANEQLKELDRLKADFITTVTHELRTPMTSLKALSKILLDKPNITPEKRADFLKIMVSETERITRLVNQVLDIEKLQSGKYEWNMEILDLSKLVKRTYDTILPVFDEQNIKHSLQMNDCPIRIEGDNDRLTQVLVNLISNAIKFCKKAGIGEPLTEGVGNVNVLLYVVEKMAILKVSDNGIGIADDKQKIIFERFTQINNPQFGKPNGSGLGLFITRRIVESHNGKIYVESEVGKGATFVIELPIAP
jgi:signal transduction histidine kinase